MGMVSVEENYKIELPQDVMEKMHIRPGDRLEVFGFESESCIIKKEGTSIARETFGILKDEIDGVEYMDTMRSQWERQEP